MRLKKLPLSPSCYAALSCLLACGAPLQASEPEVVLHCALSAPESRGAGSRQLPIAPPHSLWRKAPCQPPAPSSLTEAELLEILFRQAGCPLWREELVEAWRQRLLRSDGEVRTRDRGMMCKLLKKLFYGYRGCGYNSASKALRQTYQQAYPDLGMPASRRAFMEQVEEDPSLPYQHFEPLMKLREMGHLFCRLSACLRETEAEKGTLIPPSLDISGMLGDIYEGSLEASDRKIPHPLVTGFIRRTYQEADAEAPDGFFSQEVLQLLSQFYQKRLYYPTDLTWLHEAVAYQLPLSLFMTDFLLRIDPHTCIGIDLTSAKASECLLPWAIQPCLERVERRPIDRPLRVLEAAHFSCGKLVCHKAVLPIKQDRAKVFFCYYLYHLYAHLSSWALFLGSLSSRDDPDLSIAGVVLSSASLLSWLFYAQVEEKMLVKPWFAELFTETGYPSLPGVSQSRDSPLLLNLLAAEKDLFVISNVLYYLAVVAGRLLSE